MLGSTQAEVRIVGFVCDSRATRGRSSTSYHMFERLPRIPMEKTVDIRRMLVFIEHVWTELRFRHIFITFIANIN